MNALCQSWQLAAVTAQQSGIEYPDVNGDRVIYTGCHSKLMKISSVAKPIDMYKAQARLDGTLYLSPVQLAGNGKMEFPDAELVSLAFRYKTTVFDADTADFRLKSFPTAENEKKSQSTFAFITHNYKSHIDFDKRKGNFLSNRQNMEKVEFPVNQYICFMDEFDWFMDNSELALTDSKSKMLTMTI